jgi:hypothetical protein
MCCKIFRRLVIRRKEGRRVLLIKAKTVESQRQARPRVERKRQIRHQPKEIQS